MTVIRGLSSILPVITRQSASDTLQSTMEKSLERRPPAANAMVAKACFFRLGRVVNVAKVDQGLAGERSRDTIQVQSSEFVPLGDDHEHIGSVGCSIGIIREFNSGKDFLRLFAC